MGITTPFGGGSGSGSGDNLTVASEAEARAGVDNTKAMTPLRTKEFDEQFNPARVWQFSAFDADASNLNDGEFGLYNGANNNSGAHLSNVDTLYVPNFAATYGDDATDNSTVLNAQDLRAFFTNALDKKGYVFVELKRNGAANTAYVLAKSIAAHGTAGWRLSGLTWVDAFVPGSSGLGWDLAVSLTSESMLGALADSDVVTSNLVAVHNQTELDAVSTKPVFNAVLVLQAFSTYQVGDLLIYDKKAPGWKVEIEGRRFVQGGALALPSYDRLATNQAGRFNFTGGNNRLTVNPADVYDELILKREVYAKRRLRFGDSGAVIEFTGSFTDIQNDVFFAPFTLISGTLPASGTFTLNLLDDLSRVSALRTGEIDPNETLSNLEAVSSKAVGESLEPLFVSRNALYSSFTQHDYNGATEIGGHPRVLYSNSGAPVGIGIYFRNSSWTDKPTTVGTFVAALDFVSGGARYCVCSTTGDDQIFKRVGNSWQSLSFRFTGAANTDPVFVRNELATPDDQVRILDPTTTPNDNLDDVPRVMIRDERLIHALYATTEQNQDQLRDWSSELLILPNNGTAGDIVRVGSDGRWQTDDTILKVHDAQAATPALADKVLMSDESGDGDPNVAPTAEDLLKLAPTWIGNRRQNATSSTVNTSGGIASLMTNSITPSRAGAAIRVRGHIFGGLTTAPGSNGRTTFYVRMKKGSGNYTGMSGANSYTQIGGNFDQNQNYWTGFRLGLRLNLY